MIVDAWAQLSLFSVKYQTQISPHSRVLHDHGYHSTYAIFQSHTIRTWDMARNLSTWEWQETQNYQPETQNYQPENDPDCKIIWYMRTRVLFFFWSRDGLVLLSQFTTWLEGGWQLLIIDRDACLSAGVISEWHANSQWLSCKNLSLNTLACLWSWWVSFAGGVVHIDGAAGKSWQVGPGVPSLVTAGVRERARASYGKCQVLACQGHSSSSRVSQVVQQFC